MEQSLLTSIILPASLFIIMIGMGLSLTVADFQRVVRYPKAVLIGLGNQLIILPLVGLALVQILDLSPAFTVGILLLAACPGGPTSNLITFAAKGDIALSVTLTAISSMVTVFTIPLIAGWALLHYMGQSQDIELPVLQTMGQIFGITAFPVGIGMFIRSRNAAFADRTQHPVRVTSFVLFLLIIVGIVITNFQLLIESLKLLGIATFSLNLATISIAALIARMAKLNLAQTISIAIESGIQNGTLAIVVASSILFIPEIGLPSVVYSIAMFVSGGLMVLIFGTRKTDSGVENID